ncbi:tetratricopeptide repeat protein [Zymomonas mobilis]|uniref:Thioredoxin domain-containing protein n=1 Tax=Zymomonas mobilis subsp. mobilis (strain ATCC 10988 / DSM 424 / LMG 404 / NCIMB 8938 / NRRL B-806 / ZM1) TaxID=555217 RepID=A0A0H3G3Q2_ZYMMA|nr:tetratricopeptide repeat protein [Zymomonas mobilis]AEH63254.1 Thioredoxin domain-containing protein [Zymomonas mobilis subsp. mobilis ATCC 10988]TQL27132.1 putative thioredoxin [Zymomonas mobilis]TQL28562.1 putative thioredoxin [Zymomonas mobilis]
MSTLGLSSADQKAIENFRQQAVEPSETKLVLLYFSATWSNACKSFGAMLANIAKSYASKGVVVTSFDIDQNKIIADQLRVQSVPTLYALFQGQLVADLTPANGEAQLKQALDQLLTQLPIAAEAAGEEDIEQILEAGNKALDDSDAEQAVTLLGQAYDLKPEEAAVVGAYARALILAGDIKKAEALLSALPEDMKDKPEIHRAEAALSLAKQADSVNLDQLENLRAKVENYPDDDEARFALACDLIAVGNRDGAADQLLAILAHNRDWNEGAARTKLLQLFEVVGIEDPWVSAQRRRLSAILFR